LVRVLVPGAYLRVMVGWLVRVLVPRVYLCVMGGESVAELWVGEFGEWVGEWVAELVAELWVGGSVAD
jgi:hypothetical protein